jgi:hypothetical protein
VLTAIKKGGYSSASMSLRNASKTLQSDKRVVIEALRWDVTALAYASKELQADEEIVLFVFSQPSTVGDFLNYVSPKLLEDRNFLLKALALNGWLLEHLSIENQADKELVLLAVKNSGSVLQFASEELKSDKEIVQIAVKNDCSALISAAKELQKDRELLMEAVKQSGRLSFITCLDYSEEEIALALSDKDIVMTAVQIWGASLDDAADTMKADFDVVRAAILQNNDALKLASPELQANPELKKLAKWCK